VGETDSEQNGISDNTPLRGAAIYQVDSDAGSNIFLPQYSSIPQWSLALSPRGKCPVPAICWRSASPGERPEGYLRWLKTCNKDIVIRSANI